MLSSSYNWIVVDAPNILLDPNYFHENRSGVLPLLRLRQDCRRNVSCSFFSIAITLFLSTYLSPDARIFQKCCIKHHVMKCRNLERKSAIALDGLETAIASKCDLSGVVDAVDMHWPILCCVPFRAWRRGLPGPSRRMSIRIKLAQNLWKGIRPLIFEILDQPGLFCMDIGMQKMFVSALHAICENENITMGEFYLPLFGHTAVIWTGLYCDW